MEPEKYIRITELCSYYSIDDSFVHSLRDYGLMEIVVMEDQEVIPEEQVKDFEKMLRLHYDLDINLEGLDAIHHLLSQIGTLQEEVKQLKNRLSRWEKQQ